MRWTLAALLLVTALPARASEDRRVDRAQIFAASAAFSAAYVAGDTLALGEVYAEDALLLPPGARVQGRAAIRRYFAPRPGRENLEHSMRAHSVDFYGDTAVDVGTWSNTFRRPQGEPQRAEGTYLIVWVKGADGRWRIRHDMWHRPENHPPSADR